MKNSALDLILDCSAALCNDENGRTTDGTEARSLSTPGRTHKMYTHTQRESLSSLKPRVSCERRNERTNELKKKSPLLEVECQLT